MLDFVSSLLGGLQAQQKALGAAANNIANARTPGYKRFVVTNVEGAGGGVQASVTRDLSPGPPLLLGYDASAAPGAQPAPGAAPGAWDPSTAPDQDLSTDPATAGSFTGAAGPAGSAAPTQGSNVDLATELVNVQQAASAFELMARTLKRGDQLLGSLLDLFA
jgi:flagellar basal body rod protein FlgB